MTQRRHSSIARTCAAYGLCRALKPAALALRFCGDVARVLKRCFMASTDAYGGKFERFERGIAGVARIGMERSLRM
jgi:hypothetical protein